jgi:hypothetical protein
VALRLRRPSAPLLGGAARSAAWAAGAPAVRGPFVLTRCARGMSAGCPARRRHWSSPTRSSSRRAASWRRAGISGRAGRTTRRCRSRPSRRAPAQHPSATAGCRTASWPCRSRFGLRRRCATPPAPLACAPPPTPTPTLHASARHAGGGSVGPALVALACPPPPPCSSHLPDSPDPPPPLTAPAR